jgi:hypothetical protein
MFSLLKSAIKKDTATKAEANGGNLDDFFKKGEEKDRPNGEGKGDIRSIRDDFRASQYGLVIRDLDMEKEQTARNQSAFAQDSDDTVQRQAEANKQEPALASDHIDAPGATEDVSMQAPPDPDQNIGEGMNADEQSLRDTDNEERDRKQFDTLQSGKDAPDQENGDSVNQTRSEYPDEETTQADGNPNLSGWTPSNLDEEDAAEPGELQHVGDDNRPVHSNLNQDEMEHSPNEQFLNSSHDEAPNPGQQVGENEQTAVEKTDSRVEGTDENMGKDASLGDNELEDEEWRPRNLDEENPESHGQLDLQDHDLQDPDLQGEDGAMDNAARDDEPIEGDQVHEFDDNQFDQGYDSRDDASLQGPLTPTRDEADGNEDLPEFSDDEAPDSYDNNSNYDDPLLEQEDDIDRDDPYLETDQDQGEGEYVEEQNDEFADEGGSEMADILQQDGEVLDQADEAADVDDRLSDNDIGEPDEAADEFLHPDPDYTGEGYEDNELEHNPTTSDDLSEADDSSERDEIPEGDELDPNNDIDANGDLGEDANIEGDEGSLGEDGLEEGEERSVLADSAAAEEENSDTGSNLGSQADLEEPAPENPLSVPGKQWTEEHLAAFLIHVQSKANIFDFFTRKGVSNHERVSEVITQSLKLCLKDTSKEDTTALRSKKHATIFMEAGGTPLGPFVAFLALTVQSTSRDEKKKEEKNSKDTEETKEDEESQPASPVDEDDPWDDFDLDDDLEAAPSHFEPPKLVPVAPKPAHDGHAPSKRLEVATNIMVVMFFQAVLETSRAAIIGPAKAYLEWTFIPQALKISSVHANCEDENYGSLHEKREKLTAGDRLKWEDVNPLEYVSIGVKYLPT